MDSSASDPYFTGASDGCGSLSHLDFSHDGLVPPYQLATPMGSYTSSTKTDSRKTKCTLPKDPVPPRSPPIMAKNTELSQSLSHIGSWCGSLPNSSSTSRSFASGAHPQSSSCHQSRSRCGDQSTMHCQIPFSHPVSRQHLPPLQNWLEQVPEWEPWRLQVTSDIDMGDATSGTAARRKIYGGTDKQNHVMPSFTIGRMEKRNEGFYDRRAL